MKHSPNIQIGILKDSIVKILEKRGESLNIKQIAWELNLSGKKHHKKINLALDSLVKDEIIYQNSKYKFKYTPPKKSIVGVIDINRSGHGYVKTELYDDEIFIHQKNRLNSLNKDTVCIKLKSGKRSRLEGVVTKIISRDKMRFVGVIEDDGKNAFFIPDNVKVGSDFFIPRENLNGAKNKTRVIIQFLDWPVNAGCPFGEVIKTINDNINLKTEIETSIELFNIRNVFSEKIKRELKQLSTKITKHDLLNRKDFRGITTFTIDPEDAKDFDDALSFRVLKNKNKEVGIHIADVAHYVKYKSDIDKEAFLRAFSVYFPGRVVPMLPEKLSNLICSLRPNEDKLSFSIVLEINNNCEIESLWAGKTIINSNKQFSYEEAEKRIKECSGEYSAELTMLNNIAKSLRTKRVNEGAIEFERSNISFKLNKSGDPVKTIKKKNLNTHKLVEEFMLLANKIVAEKLSKLNLSIYRIHDFPDLEKLKELSVYLKRVELKKITPKFSEKNLSYFINKILKLDYININSSAIENLILRSMSKAKYSTKNIGHYGLGFKNYTHFTSPIRRYSDLIIHRILEKHLNKESVNFVDLEKKCIHFSQQEKLYVNVERKTTKFMQLKLLENSIGKSFKGFISGIKKWGIYVELENGAGEGLVSVIKLNDDKYYYSEVKLSFIGKNHGKVYNLGQEVRVFIESIDLFKRELDLSFNY